MNKKFNLTIYNIVELRDGSIGKYNPETKEIKIINENTFVSFKDYNENMLNKYCSDLDIMDIYLKTWERREEIKEMTLSEVEEKLGHKIKIINKENDLK